jgi:hypothetical protein
MDTNDTNRYTVKKNLDKNYTDGRIKPVEGHSLYHLVDDGDKSTERADEKIATMEEKFLRAPICGDDLITRHIPPHEVILAPWFREGSLGYIFGLRGSGKTWFAWKMAINISKGKNFGPWECGRPRKVLYVDGEMPLKSMQERLLLLDSAPFENLYMMSHDDLAEAEIIFNLCKEYQQEWLLKYCLENRVKVVFLDNLSCLCLGMRENEADDWEKVLGWLLRFRRAGIAVVIIHHANRDGNEMRGTSRREDAAFWVVKISQNHDFTEMRIGTTLTSSFTKNRDDGGHREKSIDWSFVTANGHTNVTWRPTDTREIIYELIRNGVDSNADIAAELGITKGAVSQHANQLIVGGFVKKQGGRYVLS